MRRSSLLLAACLSAVQANAASRSPNDCKMSAIFSQRDPDGARKVLSDSDALVFSVKMRVDADGGPHTYSAKDPDGRLCDPKVHPENKGKDPLVLGCAMDTLCVGANIKLPSGKVVGSGSCSAFQSAFAAIRDSHWNPPRGYELQEVGIDLETSTRPCLDANEAYIVSSSSSRSGVSNGQKCDQSKYVDTLFPSIVVPKCWSDSYRNDPGHPKHKVECAKNPAAGVEPGAEAGDLVALRGRTSGKMWYAIIGDLGPNNKLGEASVGFLMQASGRKDAPTYLRDTNSLDRREQFDVLVLKKTKYGKSLILENASDMANVAKDGFIHWGGNDISAATQRLTACGEIASPR